MPVSAKERERLNTMRKLPVYFLSAGVLFAASQAFALPTAGEPVLSIPFANEINRFETIDNRHVLVAVGERRRRDAPADAWTGGLAWRLAKVAELAYALDLGSSPLWGWGFESPLSHQSRSTSIG